MREAMATWAVLPADIKAAYTQQARGSGLRDIDLWVRAYIKGLAY